MIFLNGFGAIFGPLAAGYLMGLIGKQGYFLFLGILFAALGAYAGWRISRRPTLEPHSSYQGLSPNASSLAVGAVLAQDGPKSRAA